MKDKRIYGMFGPKIKSMRPEHGLKQRQLAKLLETDMPMYSNLKVAKLQFFNYPTAQIGKCHGIIIQHPVKSLQNGDILSL